MMTPVTLWLQLPPENINLNQIHVARNKNRTIVGVNKLQRSAFWVEGRFIYGKKEEQQYKKGNTTNIGDQRREWLKKGKKDCNNL